MHVHGGCPGRARAARPTAARAGPAPRWPLRYGILITTVLILELSCSYRVLLCVVLQ